MAIFPKSNRPAVSDSRQRSTQPPTAIFIKDRFWLKEKYWIEPHISYFVTVFSKSFFILSRIYPPVQAGRKQYPQIKERWVLTNREGTCYAWAIREEIPSAFKKINLYVGEVAGLDKAFALDSMSKLLSFHANTSLVHVFCDSLEILKSLNKTEKSSLKSHWLPNPDFWEGANPNQPFLEEHYLEMH